MAVANAGLSDLPRFWSIDNWMFPILEQPIPSIADLLMSKFMNDERLKER